MILSRYERMIAKRYLLPGKGEGFIFLVAGISLVAVMLGVAALIIVMSVMNGFRAELFDKIVGLNGHAVVQGYGGRLPDWQSILKQAKATPGVTSATGRSVRWQDKAGGTHPRPNSPRTRSTRSRSIASRR